ncbi:MAG: hypothetical protein QM487_04365 [Candidatus Marithrix sp.]
MKIQYFWLFFSMRIINWPIILGIIAFFISSCVLYCSFEKEGCPFKRNLYKYENDHQYKSFGKVKYIPLAKNKILSQCDSYDIRYKVKKDQNFNLWSNFWTVRKNNYAYVFIANIDTNDVNHVYDVNLLYSGNSNVHNITFSPLSKYISLKNSEIGKKEIYFLSFEEKSDDLESDYEKVDKQIFREYLKNNASLSFNFYLEKDYSRCLPIEISYLYSKNNGKSFEPLSNGDILDSKHQYKVEFEYKTEEPKKEVDLYIFLLKNGQEQANVIFPCHENKSELHLGLGSDSKKIYTGIKYSIPNDGYWSFDNDISTEYQMYTVMFKPKFKPNYNSYSTTNDCKIFFDKELKKQILFKNMLEFKYEYMN